MNLQSGGTGEGPYSRALRALNGGPVTSSNERCMSAETLGGSEGFGLGFEAQDCLRAGPCDERLRRRAGEAWSPQREDPSSSGAMDDTASSPPLPCAPRRLPALDVGWEMRRALTMSVHPRMKGWQRERAGCRHRTAS